MQKANVPLRLDGTRNTRELGGYYTTDGKITRTHVFLRSDALENLSDADRDFLYAYGVRLDNDLRTTAERMMAKDRINHHEMVYVDVSILRDEIFNLAGDILGNEEARIPRTMGELYIQIVETGKAEIAEVLRGLAGEEKCALFHCTNGKDRTGIIAMLLLEIVHVPEDTIIADYEVSEEYVQPRIEAEHEVVKEEVGDVLPKDYFRSDPAFMRTLIDYLSKTYGSVMDYIRTIGITDDTIEKIRAKFLTALDDVAKQEMPDHI